MKKIILLSILLIVGCDNSTEPVVCEEGLTNVNNVCQLCNEGYTEIDSLCYYQSDLDVLQDIIDANDSVNGTPLELGSLQSWDTGRLDSLAIWNMELSILPESIGNLSNLIFLSFEGNQLSTLPTSIGNLTNLKALTLDSNQLTTIPEAICNIIPNLDYCEVMNNSLCGELPSCFPTVLHGQNCP